MKKTINKILIFIFSFTLFFRVDAIDIPTNLQLVESSETSLTVQWDVVECAWWYIIKY